MPTLPDSFERIDMWSTEDIKRLRTLAFLCRNDRGAIRWKEIVKYFPNKTLKACTSKWDRIKDRNGNNPVVKAIRLRLQMCRRMRSDPESLSSLLLRMVKPEDLASVLNPSLEL